MQTCHWASGHYSVAPRSTTSV